MSYFFDNMIVTETSLYTEGFSGKTVYLSNSKDSTYSLYVRIGNKDSEATLWDFKKKHYVKFDADFEFKEVADINKLTHATLFPHVSFHKGKRYRNYVEDSEIEVDSASNQVIVHLIQYKNKKRRRVINDHYYIFGIAPHLEMRHTRSTKNYVAEKYGVQFSPNAHLRKVLHLSDGKIHMSTKYLLVKDVNFTYNFTVEKNQKTHSFKYQ